MRTRSNQNHLKSAFSRWKRGATLIEFALVAMFFLTLLIGIMEFGRWLYTLNAANEATRWGARLAVVCSISDAPDIKAKIQVMGGIPVDNMDIEYEPSPCDESSCKTVNVRLSGATFSPMIPFMGGTYQIPEFATSLPRELMNSAGNPVCP